MFQVSPEVNSAGESSVLWLLGTPPGLEPQETGQLLSVEKCLFPPPTTFLVLKVSSLSRVFFSTDIFDENMNTQPAP